MDDDALSSDADDSGALKRAAPDLPVRGDRKGATRRRLSPYGGKGPSDSGTAQLDFNDPELMAELAEASGAVWDEGDQQRMAQVLRSFAEKRLAAQQCV